MAVGVGATLEHDVKAVAVPQANDVCPLVERYKNVHSHCLLLWVGGGEGVQPALEFSVDRAPDAFFRLALDADPWPPDGELRPLLDILENLKYWLNFKDFRLSCELR